MGQGHRGLGQKVKDRRKQLGQTQAEFAERAGFSMKTLQRLELGQEQHELSPATLGGIDKAALWKPGSAHTMLKGGQPQDISPAETTDLAIIESSALVVWAAQRTGDEDAIRRAYERLTEKLSREELRAVTHRVVELIER